MINSPIKWVGGKSRLRKQIISLFPYEKHTCYVEPFAGAAWVLFGKPPSPVEVLNDVDQDLINFFRVVKAKPEELIRSFEFELVSRAEFNRLASLHPSQLSDVQRAHRFYYLIMAGWGGELDYPRFQTSITDGGHGNRLIGALKNLRKRIDPVYERLRTVIIENLSWEECINRYDKKGTFMYLDPPYPGNGCNYAHNMKTWEEHKTLVDVIADSKCQWMLSSYDTDEVRELFSRKPDVYFTKVRSASGMKTRKNGKTRVINREILVTNFRPSLRVGAEILEVHEQTSMQI